MSATRESPLWLAGEPESSFAAEKQDQVASFDQKRPGFNVHHSPPCHAHRATHRSQIRTRNALAAGLGSTLQLFVKHPLKLYTY